MIEKRTPPAAEDKHRPAGWVAKGLKRLYHRFLRIRGNPQQIALGLALGVFIGMSPFMGIHAVIAVMSASVVKWSKIAAAAGVFITNPLTAPLIYPLTYRLGATITGFSEPFHLRTLFESGGLVNLIKNSPMILVDLIVGGMILGLPLAVIAYFAGLQIITSARARIKKRRERRGRHRSKTADSRHGNDAVAASDSDDDKSCMN